MTRRKLEDKSIEKFSKNINANADEYYISTAEIVAQHLAEKLHSFNSAVDLCCMVGATTIQLAKRIPVVYGVDINSERIKKAKKNAKLYNVESRINFIQGDVLNPNFLKKITAEVAVLDPSWRKSGSDRFDFVSSIEKMRPNLKKVFDLTKKHITKNIVLRVPAKFSFRQLKEFGACEIESMIWKDVVRYKYVFSFPNINKNKEKKVYFPEIKYSHKKKYYSSWNNKKHPDEN